MQALLVTDNLPARQKEALTAFNHAVELLKSGVEEEEVLAAWRNIKHPEYIWKLVNASHLVWLVDRELRSRDFLCLMAQLWQCGARDITDTLEPRAQEFLIRLTFLLKVHHDLNALLMSDVGPAQLGWEIHRYLEREKPEVPAALPKGKSSWESYIVGVITALRLCRQGKVASNATQIQEYLHVNGLPPGVLGTTVMEYLKWLTEAAKESARVVTQS